MSGVDVLGVMDSCRNRDGLLNDTGRCIEWAMRKEREWRKHGMTECADDARAYAQSLAFNHKAAADSLRNACRAPLTCYGRAPRRRRAALARVQPSGGEG